MDWPEAVQKGELWAAGLNAVALATLWFTRRSWRAGRRETALPASPRRPRRQAVAFFVCLAAIVLFAGALRWKVAHHSLWWDEVWQARNASVGDWKPDKRNPGALKFVPTTWAQALWNYRKPTNHPPMAVASKACHEVWRRATGAPPGQFDEFVLRLPGLVASLCAVALIALLLRAWGLPGGGLVAALFLAIHPWHIRYGIDGRGYTFLVPLTLLGVWAVWRACGPGQERRPSAAWWWVLGITQGLILWCHLLSVWVCFALAAPGLWWIWSGNSGSVRRRKLARFVAVQAVGAMVFLQLFAPNLLQAATWGEKNRDGMVLDGSYLLTSLSQAASGADLTALLPVAPPRSDTPDTYTFLDSSYIVGVVAVLVLVGLLFTAFHRRDLWVATISLLASCALFLAAVAITEFYFYHRFILPVIVPVALLVGSGLGLAGGIAARGYLGGSLWVKLSLAVAAGVAFALLAPCRNTVIATIWFLRERPPTPLRETAAALRAARDQAADVFGFGFGSEALQFYLPELPYHRGSPARSALENALRNARAEGRPLYVAVGYEDLNRQNLPDGFPLLDDRTAFEEHSRRTGWEPQFTYRILRSVPLPGRSVQR